MLGPFFYGLAAQTNDMEDEPLQIIIEIQGQIVAIRRVASALADPKLQEIYLAIADLLEQIAREYDAAMV